MIKPKKEKTMLNLEWWNGLTIHERNFYAQKYCCKNSAYLSHNDIGLICHTKTNQYKKIHNEALWDMNNETFEQIKSNVDNFLKEEKLTFYEVLKILDDEKKWCIETFQTSS